LPVTEPVTFTERIRCGLTPSTLTWVCGEASGVPWAGEIVSFECDAAKAWAPKVPARARARAASGPRRRALIQRLPENVERLCRALHRIGAGGSGLDGEEHAACAERDRGDARIYVRPHFAAPLPLGKQLGDQTDDRLRLVSTSAEKRAGLANTSSSAALWRAGACPRARAAR